MSKRTTILKLAALAAVAVLASGMARAGGFQSNGCGAGGHEGGSQGGSGGLCATGPAGCVAIGLRVDVYPNPAVPYGATIELGRSQAGAFAKGDHGFGMGNGHGDAHTAQASVPATLGHGDVESSCDAMSVEQNQSMNWAHGAAEISRLALSLAPYGVPVDLSADVLRETGYSASGAGANAANIADLSGSVASTPIPAISESAPPNTMVPLGPLGTLWLNEQKVVPPSPLNPCPIFNGDAARLVVNNPATGAPAAQVLLSWVSTSTCK